MIPALLMMLAAAGFESTGCYRRHLNFAAGGGAEAILGNTGATVDRRPHHRADVGDPRRWPSRYGRDTRPGKRVSRWSAAPSTRAPPSRRSLTDDVVVIENGRISSVGQGG